MSGTIRDFMTTPVVTVRQNTPFKVIVSRTLAARIGAVPVIDDAGLVIGIVSAHDLLARKAGPARPRPMLPTSLRHRHQQAEMTATTAGQLMTSRAAMIRADATTQDAARLMYRHRAASLAVVDPHGRLIGIISQDDILSTFNRSDQSIHHEVVADVMVHDFAVNPQAFTVTVRQGIVTLAGRPETDPVGHSLAAAVRHIDGVVAVRDQLSYKTSAR